MSRSRCVLVFTAGLAAACAAAPGVTHATDAPAAANAPRTVSSLRLSRALEVVWTENPQVREAEMALVAAGYDVSGSYGGFLPSITILNADGRNAVSSVQGTLPLLSGGRTLAQIDETKAREAAARAALIRTRLVLGRETMTAFYNQVQAQEQLRQWQTYLAALARLQATIVNRARQGVAPEADVQTAVSRLRQAEVGQETASLLLSASRNELRRLLQFVPANVTPDSALPPAVLALTSVPARNMVDANPDVRIATAQVEEQVAVTKQARALLLPEIALQYRHYYEGETFDPTADEPQLVLQYQLGNSYTGYQRVKAEASKIAAARARLDVVRLAVAATINLAREQLASSARQLRLQEQAAANTQALVESFLRQYQAGRRSWLDVLNVQREAHENELGLIASRKAYLFSGQNLALESLAWDLLVSPSPP